MPKREYEESLSALSPSEQAELECSIQKVLPFPNLDYTYSCVTPIFLSTLDFQLLCCYSKSGGHSSSHISISENAMR